MRVLYIGYYNEGSTARMRGEYLKDILSAAVFKVINIDIPLHNTSRLLRSFGWRYQKGPLINNINNYILDNLKDDFRYDLVWIDKGVFIQPAIIEKLKKDSATLVHFTPDPAFTYHRSKLFYKALPLYDYCITTKSFEIKDYETFGVKTIFCTQGYDPQLHKPYHSAAEKSGIVFIGHKEDEREYIIAKLIEARIAVTIAGNHWDKFAAKRKNNNCLVYKGKGIYAAAYAQEISGAKIGLGFLSKWIPELHTTRTFEIPACGTALVTEDNSETKTIFSNEEAIFYKKPDDVLPAVSYYLSHPEVLNELTAKGHKKVTEGGYSYKEILKGILKRING
jgi:spore maturation protein CgeB